MNWICYLLEANLYLTIFYGLYHAVLKRETFYQANRAYILATSLLAFVIPLLQLGFLKPAELFNASFSVNRVYQPVFTQTPPTAPLTPLAINPAEITILIYMAVSSCLMINFVIKLCQLIRLSGRHLKITGAGYKLVEIAEEKDAFSFFNYLFISPQLASKQTVIDHELVHIRQRHSWDIIYTELLKIISWFNPAVYLLQYSLKELHEFAADRETAGNGRDTSAYTDFLLRSAYGTRDNSLVNTFLIKAY